MIKVRSILACVEALAAGLPFEQERASSRRFGVPVVRAGCAMVRDALTGHEPLTRRVRGELDAWAQRLDRNPADEPDPSGPRYVFVSSGEVVFVLFGDGSTQEDFEFFTGQYTANTLDRLRAAGAHLAARWADDAAA